MVRELHLDLAEFAVVIAVGRLVSDQILAAHPATVAEFKAGKAKAFNSLVGEAMKATRGKANPAQVNAILKKKLGV